MKPFLILLASIVFVGCSGPGGPAQRAGAAVDRTVYKVGEGISKVGEKIEGASGQ